jgi:hypothetical protein
VLVCRGWSVAYVPTVDHPTLFLETLDDLSARVQRPGSEYDSVMTAALLRKLLLDSPTLPDVVNAHRLKVRYVVNGRLPIWIELGEPPPTMYSVEDGFDPETALMVPVPKTVSRDGLLSQIVAFYRSQEVTAKNLVEYVAHTVGGVHFDPPRTDAERNMQSLAASIRVGNPAGTRTLLAIGRVVLRGLGPLRGQVEQDLS